MKSIKSILKYVGYILIVPSYIIFFILFLSYLAYFCSQILTGVNVDVAFYQIFVSYGFILPNDIFINFMSSIIILLILIAFICVISYMIQILKIHDNTIVHKRMKIKFNIAFIVLILLNISSLVFRNYYVIVPDAMPNGNLIPIGILIWGLVILISKKNI